MKSKRIVITGFGLVTPLGCGNELVCKRLLDGFSGIKSVNSIPELNIPISCSISAVAPVPFGKHDWNSEYPNEIQFGSSKQLSRFIEFGILASDLALKHANINSISDHYDLNRVGVAVGNGGIGSLREIIDANHNLSLSYKKLSPYFVPKVLSNMTAGHISIKYGLKGPVHSVATACAAGAHSIGDAYNFIRLGYADMMLAGGADSSIDELSIAGFARMKALGHIDHRHDIEEEIDIQHTSRPFHKDRNGFVIGEGAGVLVLEELSSALSRGARILGEICGYGLSGDAYNSTAPSLNGDGAARSMIGALKDANISPGDIGYINAHATSTPVGDAVEVNAIRKVFGHNNHSDNNNNNSSTSNNSTSTTSNPSRLYVSSTKGATGHLLGAAGAVETIFTTWAIHTGIMPPTLHLTSSDEIDPLLYGNGVFMHIPNHSIDYKANQIMTLTQQQQQQPSNQLHNLGLNYAMNNSFGFGGTNCSLVIGKYKSS